MNNSQIVITYKDNSKKVINVNNEFFNPSEVREGYKTNIISFQDKVVSLAETSGKYYKVILYRNSNNIFEKVNSANEPSTELPHWMNKPMVSSKELKRLKKEHKNQKFTKIFNPNIPNLVFYPEKNGYKQGSIDSLLNPKCYV